MVKGHIGQDQRSKVTWVKVSLRLVILAGGLTSTSSCILIFHLKLDTWNYFSLALTTFKLFQFLYLISTIYISIDEEIKNIAIRQAVFEDKESSLETWQEIAKLCKEHGFGDMGLEIVAAATVCTALRGATQQMTTTQTEQESNRITFSDHVSKHTVFIDESELDETSYYDEESGYQHDNESTDYSKF